MEPTQLINTPLGHTVLLSTSFLLHGERSLQDIVQVVATPVFLIKVRGEALYFFRSLDWDVNLMVEATASGKNFIVKQYLVNPSTEYISGLLAQGSLVSFI
jgi:hypothetical protein